MSTRLVRFGAVGVINTGVYYGCYLGLHPWLPFLVAHLCAFAIAMVGSYFLNCYITFRQRPRWRTFLLFPLSSLANLTLTTVGLQLAVGSFGVDSRVAPLPVAIIAIPITYVVAHYILLGRVAGSPVAVGGAGQDDDVRQIRLLGRS